MKYRGFSIEKECDLYAVRLYQPEGVHDWKPWADSIEEARAIVDKLLSPEYEVTHPGTNTRWKIKLTPNGPCFQEVIGPDGQN